MKYAGLVVAACAVAAVLPGRAYAGDAPAGDERTRAVAAALENENLRMRAKIESAALLEKSGRRDEAVAALREVEAIRAEGKALVASLLAPSPGRPVVTFPPPGTVSIPLGPNPRAAPPLDQGSERVPMRPAPYLLGGARRILGDRRPDRLWHSGTAGEGPVDLVTSGMAVLALLDASDLENDQVIGGPDAAAWSDAAFESLTALAPLADAATGRFGDAADPEAHAVATWALAAGLTRFGEAPWRPVLRRAVARALEDRNAAGLWPTASGRREDGWVLAGFMVAMLHEAAFHEALLDGDTMSTPPMPPLAVAYAIDRAQRAAFADQIAAEPPASTAAALARACLARAAARELGVSDLPGADFPRIPKTENDRLDATALLFAAALRGLDSNIRRQDRALWDETTWNAGDARSLRHGPTYGASCVLLSLLAPTSHVRFPKSS